MSLVAGLGVMRIRARGGQDYADTLNREHP